MSTGLGKFTVDGKIYSYEKLNPKEAIQFGTRVLKAVGPSLAALALSDKKDGQPTEASVMEALRPALGDLNSDLISQLCDEAIARCYTPQNQPLADDAIYNLWFGEHPSQLFMVGGLAVFHLTKDFFPKTLVTKLGNSQMLRATASTSPSQTDGK